ncbi:MAG TPA: FG-GAP-like repeat-containing protein [Candidatus Angelobacter sp.]|nr:FG-GAP-like repeat-containing protein [Candidatus Angelobacter sp.]
MRTLNSVRVVDSLLAAPAGLMRAGLGLAESIASAAQTTLERVARIETGTGKLPPLEGPQDLDHAFSELANRTMRIIHFTPAATEAVPVAIKEWLQAARFSFRFMDWKDPRSLALGLAAPFSLATLGAQAGQRGLLTLEAIGLPRYLEFIKYCVQIFSEFPVYVGLEYGEVIEKHKRWLEHHPDDSTTRTELGRTLIKVGRFEEAREELARGAEDPTARSVAMHEMGLAYYNTGDFTEAIRAGCAALEANPKNQPARHWVWLASERLGGYPSSVPASFRMKPKGGWEKTGLQYDEISALCGLDKTSGARGIAVFDYNNDGLLDVVIAAAHAGISLYRNNGNSTFTDVSVQSGLYRSTNGFGITAGDYNNDGRPDLCVCRMGFYGGECELWRNNGDGTFTNVSQESGVGSWGPSFSVSWVDYDCDGWLDLFVATNLGGLFDRKTPNRLFHNNRDGTFTDVAVEAGITSAWPTIGHSWGDYNNDGYPDLFLSNAIGPPELYRNNGDGTFTNVTNQANLNHTNLAFGAQWCDIDDDGWLDIIQYSWAIHEDVVDSMQTGEAPPYAHPTRIYRNNRDGTFTEIGRELGITECWGSMSGNAADLNNDGHLDIALGNGGPLMDRSEPLVVLENNGTLFRNVTYSAGLPPVGKGHGLNCADLFNDGRLSILVGTGGNYPGDLMTSSVFCPKKRPGNYLAVHLTGTESNRSAIGARLRLVAGGREQHRVLNGGSNFGCLPPDQHFGLANLTCVESLEVWWPSGVKQRFENLPVNEKIWITEGQINWSRECAHF